MCRVRLRTPVLYRRRRIRKVGKEGSAFISVELLVIVSGNWLGIPLLHKIPNPVVYLSIMGCSLDSGRHFTGVNWRYLKEFIRPNKVSYPMPTEAP